MIRVMHILTDTNIGGAGRLLLTLLRHVNKEEFSLLVLLPKGSLLSPLFRAEGISTLETEGGRDRSFSFQDVKELTCIIRREKPDVVHTHASLSGRIAATLCGVKGRVYTRHCAFPPSKAQRSFPRRQITSLLTRVLSTDIIAVANAARDDLLKMGVPDSMITIILNGVEPLRNVSPAECSALRASLGIPQNATVFGMVARMEAYKGHAELLASAEKVLAAHDSAYFILLGCGSEEASLRRVAAQKGLDRVIFTGFCPDVAPYFHLMDVHINNSYGTETASLAIQEAASLGIPTVATDYGGNPEIIRHGEDGILVPVHAPDALAEALLSLVEDPPMRRRLGEGALNSYLRRGGAAAMARLTENVWRRRQS